MSLDDLAIIDPGTRAALREWLHQHHRQTESVWVMVYKKSAGKEFLATGDVVDECLCFGWIDSRPRKYDERCYLLLISPRRPGSQWSAVNKQRIKSLISNELMTPHGLRVIAAARKSGHWNALRLSDELIVPDALAEALAANSEAERNFNNFSQGSRRTILEWIYGSKTEATRMRRITRTVLLAAQGIKANLVRSRRGADGD